MNIEFLANTTALLLSFVSIVVLGNASFQADGKVGNGLRLIAVGVFLSVFCHAVSELLCLLEIIDDDEGLFTVMGILMSVGSLLFSVGGLMIINNNSNTVVIMNSDDQ